MISLFVKFKFKLSIYLYLYLCYKKYMQNIIFCVFLLNYFFNLFIILINIFFILYLCQFYMLNKIVKMHILIFCQFNYIILKFIIKFTNLIMNLYKIDIFDYFFFNFNKLKFFNFILKYLIIIKIINLFLYDIILNREYYKFYYLYLRQKAIAWYYSAIVRLDRRFAIMILNTIFKIKNIYKRILLKYKNKRKYKLMVLYYCIKFLKKIYKIYLYFVKV
jgi:hypothetical protein